MESAVGHDSFDRTRRSRQYGRVLLREPERCPECNRVYLSLYRLRVCADHEGLEEM